MTLKKKQFSADEIAIYEDAIIYKRGDIWQFRMWLEKERKYARSSLRTSNQSTAIDKAKQQYHELKAQELAGKTYFSKTVKQGVELYLAKRQRDVEAEDIGKGRLGTIKTHLEHFMDFIGRDTKLKDLHRMDCENYLLGRKKTKKKVNVSNTTIANEQSTINALISWLHKHSETYIDAFELKRPNIPDRGDDDLRRSIFDEDEIWQIREVLEKYVTEAKRNLETEGNLSKFVTGSYLLISMITGMRRGEQLQLKWSNIKFQTIPVEGSSEDDAMSLPEIHIPHTISKVKKSRRFQVADKEYFHTLQDVLMRKFISENGNAKGFAETLVFSQNSRTAITPKAISYLFYKIIEIAEIRNVDKRDLVPYSFRHSFITHMINLGLKPVDVADICGTSDTQISKTYYHMTEKRRTENALPGMKYEGGVLIIPDFMKKKPRIRSNSIS